MPDREKVIKGLTELKKYLPSTMWEPINNALALLKEQQEQIEKMNFIYGFVYGGQVKEIKKLVRCKDCKHWSAERINDYNKCRRWINVGVKNFATMGDWFCADGERK